jgi:hypothetical protein
MNCWASKFIVHLALGCALIGLNSQYSRAAVVTYTGGDGATLSASATFNLTGTTLTVTLTNTSPFDVLMPTDVLQAVFFNTSTAAGHGLTPVSASLNGSSVFYGSIVNNVGEGWSYASGISAHGENSGISAAGLGVFGAPNFFSPPVTPLDGTDYGILSAGDNPATGNTGVTGHGPLIQDSVQFTLTTGANFSLGDLGSTVVFQYGTGLDEPSFNGPMRPSAPSAPEPMSLVVWSTLIGTFGACYAFRRNRQRAV